MPLPCGNNLPTPLADMQDLYGLAPNTSVSNTPDTSTSNASKASTSNPSSRSCSPPSFSFARILRRKQRASSSESSSTAPSDSRRSSMDSQTTLTGTAVPTSSKTTSVPRDYEAALGTLSSSYGFTGAPLRPSAISKTMSKQGQKPERSHS